MVQPAKFNGNSKSRMKIESLHNRRRDDRISADVVHKLHCIFNSLFAAYTVGRATERKIERKVFEETNNPRALVDTDTRQLADTNTRIRQRRHLRAREKVKAVLVVILVYENLRSLFRRDRLLNVVGEHLPEREIRSDVDVGYGDEAVFEIVHAVDVKTRTTLIRMSVVSRGPKIRSLTA